MNKHKFTRQDLINLLFFEGIGLTGVEIDSRIKRMNGNEMSLSDRTDWCYRNFDKCRYWFTDNF